jgi:hypothetical protein
MRRVLINSVSVATCAALLLLGKVSAYQKADPQAFNGTWKLDAAASTNPNGPQNPGAVRAPRPTGGARGGSGAAGGGGGEGASGGSDAALGGGERQRFYAMMKILTHAPATLGIAATPTEVTLSPDQSKPFHHMTNGKTEKLPVDKNFGDLEIKTKWDGAALKREVKTIDGLTVAETYTLSGDGKQLLVSIDLKSQVERLSDDVREPIKRVYTRGQ